MSPIRRFSLLVSSAAVALLALAPTGAYACTPITNVQTIFDDSGSMSSSDPYILRKEGLKLLLNKEENLSDSFSADEFGTSAFAIFAPLQVSANLEAMESALDKSLVADNDMTNYNAAFDLAKTTNPTAGARIFLTDGAHNQGEYQNGHLEGPPTYVIGFGDSTEGEDGERLAKITSDTGGKYYPQTTSENLQAVMNDIDSKLNCSSKPVEKTHEYEEEGDFYRYAARIKHSNRPVTVVLSWHHPRAEFEAYDFIIRRNGEIIAVGAEKEQGNDQDKEKSRFKAHPVKKRKTFQIYRLYKIKKGLLKFKVKVNKLPTFGGKRKGRAAIKLKTKLTVQVTQDRRIRKK